MDNETSIRNWRTGAIITGILAAISIVALALWGVTIPGANTNPGTPAEDLTVRVGDVIPREAKCLESDEFIKNSLSSTDLRWSDSVSTPFTATTPEGMFGELLNENCGNPTVLMMNVEALSKISVEEGLTIGDVNPWMADFISQKESGLAKLDFLTKKVGYGDDLFVTTSFQEVAELTNTVLLRLKVVGISNDNSLENWHVAARDGLAAGTLPVATLNETQEKALPALRLEYTHKTECPLFAIGFNIADKRFELLPVNCGTPPTVTQPPCKGDCEPPKLEPKGDSPQPPGKPPVGDDGGPEVTPPDVTTETDDNPGGVNDTPTNPPGSETGGDAPDSTPVTKDDRKDVPPNEGGNNDGTVGADD